MAILFFASLTFSVLLLVGLNLMAASGSRGRYGAVSGLALLACFLPLWFLANPSGGAGAPLGMMVALICCCFLLRPKWFLIGSIMAMAGPWALFSSSGIPRVKEWARLKD